MAATRDTYTQVILIALDGSEPSTHALNCEYTFIIPEYTTYMDIRQSVQDTYQN